MKRKQTFGCAMASIATFVAQGLNRVTKGKMIMKKSLVTGLAVVAMNVPICLLAAFLVISAAEIAVAVPIVFINEIHYDNAGADSDEAIEIAGHAGTDLTGWSLVLYNGSNGASYNTSPLSFIIPNQSNGFGVVLTSIAGIQNGSPDGIALIDSIGTVVQFLSYEGAFTAVGGPANGLTSIDIGVSEESTSTVGYSLQLTGVGSSYDDFTWSSPMPNTFGSPNTGQTFVAAVSNPVPEPSTIFLLGTGIAGLTVIRFRRRK